MPEALIAWRARAEDEIFSAFAWVWGRVLNPATNGGVVLPAAVADDLAQANLRLLHFVRHAAVAQAEQAVIDARCDDQFQTLLSRVTDPSAANSQKDA